MTPRSKVVGRSGWQRGRGPFPARQVVVHDVSRLKLLQRLLSDDGVIFISIDDNELYNLKATCDEIFGARNFIANIVWPKKRILQEMMLSEFLMKLTTY